MKLTSMTDFVLTHVLQGMQVASIIHTQSKKYNDCFRYADFLMQPLNISMFIPAKLIDGEWVVLIEPEKETYDLTYPYDFNLYSEDIEEYETAKSNILFEGFEIEQDSFINDSKELYIKKDKIKFGWNYNNTNWNFYFKTIEDLVKFKPTLTATAKKQLGL